MPTEVPYRDAGTTPPGADYASYMRKKMGLDNSGNPMMLPVPGQTLANSQFVGKTTAPIGVDGPQFTPGKTVNANQYSWNSDLGTTTGAPGTAKPTMASRVFSDRNMKKVGELAQAATPFISNIANAFRKPPMPKRSAPNPYTTLQKINLQEDRNAVERNTNASNKATERNVDANTAEAIKQFNQGTEFERLSQISDREQQANTGIANQQAMMDTQTAVGNNEKVDEYNQALVERNAAQQREQSANWANAGDKMVAIRNEKEKGRVEMSKARILRSVYEKSGVLKRDNAIGQQWKSQGLPDPFNEDYKWLDPEKKAMGGILMGVPSRKL